ncbi:hypothetical protein Chor_010978 [Crotalus horridus]
MGWIGLQRGQWGKREVSSLTRKGKWPKWQEKAGEEGLASPTIYPNLDILRVKLGDSVNLLCSGKLPVEWIGIQNGSTVILYDNGTLYMPKASCNQMGNYQCAYINKPEEGIRTKYVAVTDNLQPLTVTIEGIMDQVRLQGEPFNISCRVQYHSPEYYGTWIYPPTANASTTIMEIDTGLAKSYTTDFTLLIPAVQLQDSGKYTCLGQISQTIVNASVTLQVLATPKITALTNISNGLQCEVTGYPPPHIQWYKLPPNIHRCGQHGILILNDSSPEIMSKIPFVKVSLKSVLKMEMEDSMIICCFAVNSAGNDSRPLTFYVDKVTGNENETPTLLIAIFGGVMGFLLLCIVFLIYKYKQYLSDSGFGCQSVDSYLEMKSVTTSVPMPAQALFVAVIIYQRHTFSDLCELSPNPGRSLVSAEGKEDPRSIDLFDLLQFSNQVAQGMTFLASKNDYTNLPCPREEEDSGCEPASYFEESCESGEVEQPLLNSNNYQFC